MWYSALLLAEAFDLRLVKIDALTIHVFGLVDLDAIELIVLLLVPFAAISCFAFRSPKRELILVAHTAAVPAGVLSVAMILSFTRWVEKLSWKLMTLAGFTLVVSTLVMLLPAAIAIFVGRPRAAAFARNEEVYDEQPSESQAELDEAPQTEDLETIAFDVAGAAVESSEEFASDEDVFDDEELDDEDEDVYATSDDELDLDVDDDKER